MIRAVIFDLGHTFWDILPDQHGALDAAYAGVHATLKARLGGELPEAAQLRDAVAAALRADTDSYFLNKAILDQPPSHKWVDIGCRSLGLELDDALLREITIPLFATELDRLSVMPGTVEAVRDLRTRGLALGCVTNTLTDQQTIEQMLERYGFGDLLDAVVVSTTEGYRKPHPMLFTKAACDLGVATKDALLVGDSPYHDVGGAKAVGMLAVLTRQYASRPWVDGVPEPDGVIDHLAELAGVLDALSTGT